MVGGIQLKMVSNCSFYLFDLDDETNDESDFGGDRIVLTDGPWYAMKHALAHAQPRSLIFQY